MRLAPAVGPLYSGGPQFIALISDFANMTDRIFDRGDSCIGRRPELAALGQDRRRWRTRPP
jgi:hypothetical protein